MGTTPSSTYRDLESGYKRLMVMILRPFAQNNASNMFSIRIHHGRKFQRYPGRMYVSGRVDIFDMVGIDLFLVVALNMMVLKLGYTALSLIEVYIEHGVIALDSYLREPRFRAILEEITDEPGSIAANRTEKMLLTYHEFSETTKCDNRGSSRLVKP
ncbi:hypothetical protein Tco_1160043 [Tanacetum coccineum]